MPVPFRDMVMTQLGTVPLQSTVMLSQLGVYACRFFLVFSAVYIFQPPWIRKIELRIIDSIRIMPLTSQGMLNNSACPAIFIQTVLFPIPAKYHGSAVCACTCLLFLDIFGRSLLYI
jgi:hypothetical protein